MRVKLCQNMPGFLGELSLEMGVHSWIRFEHFSKFLYALTNAKKKKKIVNQNICKK